MEDAAIVALYWDRDESAISHTQEKYDRYLMKIAMNILMSTEDSEESVNDTYLKAWDSMPPHRPDRLSLFLGKITRERSIDIYRRKHSQKREGSMYAACLDELSETLGGGPSPEDALDLKELGRAISDYLRRIPEKRRNVFICRYFYMDPLQEIADKSGLTVANIKSILFRERKGLQEYLEKEGFAV